LRNLPQEVAGALFSRYSRSAKSVRRLLLDEFLESDESGLKGLSAAEGEGVDLARAQDFFERILAGYGDDSIGELGGVHIACENISNIAAKVIEDARIGISPLEKSSRYVRFDEQDDGKYRYLRDPEIMASPHAAEYEAACDMLFDTYARLIDPMMEWVKEQFPQQADEPDRAYNASVKAKALDALRGLLPAATRTNVGLYGNGRAFEFLLIKMQSHDLAEIRELAGTIKAELDTEIPSMVSRADPDDAKGRGTMDFYRATRQELRDLTAQVTAGITPEVATQPGVTLLDHDPDGERKVLAGLLYEHTQIREALEKMSEPDIATQFTTLSKLRGNRRHRLGRGLEATEYEFDIVCDFGAYRDLQRHRVLSQERQRLSVVHGYDVPEEITTAGHETAYRAAMDAAALAFNKIAVDLPEPAQYVVPFGYRMRFRMRMNLREACHLIELRSTPQGHPAYRFIAQQMFERIKEVHPRAAAAMNFVDLSQRDDMERRESEKRTAKKLAELDSKRNL
jgi:thymidylate synthase ThyX